MEIVLTRKWYTGQSTIGEMQINGTWFCFTLEDTCRDLNRDGDLTDQGEKKIYGVTCIPAGRYQVVMSYSSRYKKLMPYLVGVPGYEGIMIHIGNWAKDTEGCLLIGATRGTDFIGYSKETFDRFYIRLKALLTAHKVYITIVDTPLI